MKMDKSSSSVLEMKRSCLVSKSVKCLLNEVQSVYGEKLRRLEWEMKGSQEEILRVKVRILHSYVNDLSDQNRILVHTVEELEKEASEKVADLKAKLQTSEEGINDLDHQKRRLEEDNKRLRAEIQQLKADTRTLTRVIQEAQRAHGLDITGLTLRTQPLDCITDQSAHSSQLSQKPGDLMKAQVEDLRNQLKTKNRIIQRLEEEIKMLLSHRIQEKNELQGRRVAEALEEVCKEEACKPSVVQKRTHSHTEQIHKTESRLSAAQKRLHETKKQLTELKKECEQKQNEVEKLQEEITKREVLEKENAEELQRVISEKRNLELELAVIAEKHRTAQQEVSSRDQVILQLRAELRVSVEKNQGVREELGLQEAEVSRLNEKVRKQQAHLQELREMCRHGNARMDQEQQKTQQLQSQLQLAQQQLKRQAERTERLQGELTASRLEHAADAERWTQRNLLLHREVQQLQEQNVQHTQLLGELREKLREAEHTQHLAQEKVTEYEEFLKKRDTEIRLLNQQLEEIQDEVQKSRNSSQSQRSALDIFKQKYTTAMEKVQQLQVQIQRAEEEAELSQKQVVEARAEVCSLRAEISSLESRYEQKARQAELSEEAMELLTDELQAALDSLRSREERNLLREEEMDRQQKQVEKEVALVKAELQNTLLTLQTRSEELQELHEEMRKVTEEKNQTEKENQVMRNELKHLDHQLQQLLSFFTDTADTVLEQEDSAVFSPSFLKKTEQQLSDHPEEKEDICQLTRLQSTCEKLRAEVGVLLRSLQKAVEEAEMQQRLVCEVARERDEAREQLQQLKRNLEETRTENSHLHQEREQLVTSINLWITEHKAANESLAGRIKQQNELLTTVSLERENQLANNLNKIDDIQSRLRSNMQSVKLLNQQLSSMREENKKNRKLLEKERKRRSHLELLLGLRVDQSLVPLLSPPSLEPSDLELDQTQSVRERFSAQPRGTCEKRSKSALQ
ncbi:putative leucine-rich repeat-containing protein DDB_G0290503 isoform X2 [Pangasianodon hypophthalmus]|uniref:putative leucine-rich repeat-containing protein DDB_G0290503 isoform X2 n=1 Tax=Pangasianodon hypophthalmus TaxID=310915 RepID=UPI0023070221|nr:putative leucine-rich repeat-containing protein DDB_G0290503 isoform X2 [Pangasianodon hypophthalmus]